jgi:hypothetical protein
MEYKMKLALGYILNFLAMTVIVSALAFGIFLFCLCAMAFVTWSLPAAAAPIAWWIAGRVCIVIGVVTGFWYIVSKEGREAAKEFADEF